MIYIVAHKPAPLLSGYPSGYKPLLVGSNKDALQRFYSDSERDDTGENIAALNPFFCELTGMYWVWKNVEDEQKGIVHYRRYFTNLDKVVGRSDAISYDSVKSKLSVYDCVLPKARPLLQNVRKDYDRHQVASDMDRLRDAIAKLEPAYLNSFDSVMRGRYLHAFNMLIARRRVFDDFCAWMFPLLFDAWERIDVRGRSGYRQRAIGFLSERLLDVWLPVSGCSWVEVPIAQPEITAKERFSVAIASLTAGRKPPSCYGGGETS